MYDLLSEKQVHLRLNNLSLNIPLACKKADDPLLPLSGTADLGFGDKLSKATLHFNSNTYAVELKHNGQQVNLQTNAEYTRLQHYFLKCWINLLQSRQATSTSRHQTEIAAAQRELKGLSHV